MNPQELLSLLQDFYRETLELVLQRQVRARSVTAYDANNAYQQVLGRHDTHLRWLSDAIGDLGGTPPVQPAGDVESASLGKGELTSILEADARGQQAFLDRWAPRAQAITNARHRKLLGLILGEMAEHLRMFEQALMGRLDVLGRHTDGKILSGEVLAGRPRQ